jgi:hypothetical protein
MASAPNNELLKGFALCVFLPMAVNLIVAVGLLLGY